MKPLSLKKVYEKTSGELPALDTLPWCVLESTNDLIFSFCDGVSYALIFDIDSFLKDVQSKEQEVTTKITTTTINGVVVEESVEEIINDYGFVVLNQIT